MIKLAQTYLYRPDGAWFVSTVNRCSSARWYDAEYAETLVWTLDANGKRDKLVWQGSDGRSQLTTHIDAVTKLHRTGRASAT